MTSLPRHVRIGNLVVRRTQIISTNHFVYDVWEPTAFGEGYSTPDAPAHSTISSRVDMGEDAPEGKWFGRLGTRRLTVEQNAVPVGEERFALCAAQRAGQNEMAQAAIAEAYPHLAPLVVQGIARREDDGEVTATEILPNAA